ncbi:MAG: hypothetical protein M1833_003880 [Piccolia ochrophora]|nr:MAG: hypothetical protein M1833_003880 [Piccolia ochrophora]
MAGRDAVVDLKKAFLSTQVRVLNAPLHPPHNWQDQLDNPDDGDLRESTVTDVLTQLESKVRHHNRAVYSSQALRQVAEQIDALYWASGERGGYYEGDDGLGKGVDLTRDGNISNLPEQWPEDENAEDDELARYSELHSQLATLSARRQTAQQRLAHNKHLQELLAPFKKPQQSIQPNLATRDGELGKELDKMRILMARVGGRLDDLNSSNGSKEGRASTLKLDSEEDKMNAVMETF